MLLHPSNGFVLLSSHVSHFPLGQLLVFVNKTKIPSPHIDVQREGELMLPGVQVNPSLGPVHVSLQYIGPVPFPSSQVSPLTTKPSPQILEQFERV